MRHVHGWLRRAVAGAAFSSAAVITALPATAEAPITVLFFTADWCPSCRIMQPALADALNSPEGRLATRVDLDMTATRRGDAASQASAAADAVRELERAKATYLWDYYGGFTGVAVIVAADTGEALACVTRLQDAETIRQLIISSAERLSRPPGARLAPGAVPQNCP